MKVCRMLDRAQANMWQQKKSMIKTDHENLPFYSQFRKRGHCFFTPFINVTNICCRQCLMNDCSVDTVADYGLLLDEYLFLGELGGSFWLFEVLDSLWVYFVF